MDFAICILVFALLGIVVNIAAFIVISKRKNRSMFHDLLKILTLYDILVVICCALQFALPEVWPAYAKNVHPYVMVILLPTIHIAVMTSVYCTILISFERYIRICYYCQLKDTSILTEDNIKYYQMTVIIFPILFYIPKLFEVRAHEMVKENVKLINCGNYMKLSAYLENPKTQAILHQQFNLTDLERIETLAQLCRKEEELHKGENITTNGFRNVTISRTKVLSIVPTPLRKNKYYHNIYFVYLNTIFASVLPLCLLLFFNTRTAHELIIMSRYEKNNNPEYGGRRRSNNSHSNRESIISYSNGGGENQHNDENKIEVALEDESGRSKRHNTLSTFETPIKIREEEERLTFSSDNERRKSRVSFCETRIVSKRHTEEIYSEDEERTTSNRNGGLRRSFRRMGRFHSAGSLVSSVRNSFSEKAAHMNKEHRLARISICIVWLFIFCHACKLIPTGYEVFILSTSNQDKKWPSWIVFVENVSHTLITLNSALNFIIYVIL